jgi:hypothetical protein
MPSCQYCGSELNSEDLFCPNCGRTVAIAIAPEPSKPKKSHILMNRRGTILIIVSLLIGSLLIGASVGVIRNSNNNQPTQAATTTNSITITTIKSICDPNNGNCVIDVINGTCNLQIIIDPLPTTFTNKLYYTESTWGQTYTATTVSFTRIVTSSNRVTGSLSC